MHKVHGESAVMRARTHWRMCGVVAIAIAACGIWAGRARAATVEGTLVTNVASSTYASMQFMPFTVTFNSTATVQVAMPHVLFRKWSNPAVECTGATITFCIWVVNDSPLTSAFNVILRDVFPPPDVMAYVAGQELWAGNTAGASICKGRGTYNFGETYDWLGCPEPPDGQTSPYYLRWAVSMIGPAGKSALICFKMRIL